MSGGCEAQVPEFKSPASTQKVHFDQTNTSNPSTVEAGRSLGLTSYQPVSSSVSGYGREGYQTSSSDL